MIDQVKIRAKSTIKLQTAGANHDIEMNSNSKIEGIAREGIKAILYNHGKTEDVKIINEMIECFEDGWRDPE